MFEDVWRVSNESNDSFEQFPYGMLDSWMITTCSYIFPILSLSFLTNSQLNSHGTHGPSLNLWLFPNPDPLQESHPLALSRWYGPANKCVRSHWETVQGKKARKQTDKQTNNRKQSTNQPTNQSNQSINQLINQWINLQYLSNNQ